MKHVPTDLEILDAIYNRYYDDFVSYDEDNKIRSNKIHVPIDIIAISRELGVDEDIVFGRLYYHLNEKFGYKQDNNVQVNFFNMQVGGDRHCIQFPMLASVLADLREENRKYRIATGMAELDR